MPRHRLIAALAALAASASPAAAQEVVSVPHFSHIELHGGGEVVLRHGPVQRVTIVRGSSEFTRIRVTAHNARQGADRLVIDACNARCPNHYALRIEIETPAIDALAVHGGGEIVASSGFPAQSDLAVAVHGGGEIDTRLVTANDVAAAVHGGGLLRVRASANLAASVNGGGEVRYWGSPEVAVSINGGGTVHNGE
ncbi:MAG TPA: DUF2807 domain-containing protein [Allosphingosinicella sp.]|nr:DUF2807 domain-containing protein [Allosphingosinicella sp.]